MKSHIFNDREWTLAVTALALWTGLDAYLYHTTLTAGWDWYTANHEAVAPIFNWVGGAVAAWVALSQLSIARKRHDAQVKRDVEQTNADKQRRIQESFAKAVEQLGSDKLQVRLGGIYTLERIYMQETRDDYWVIMETLTAFIREQTRSAPARTDILTFTPSIPPLPDTPPTDIAAALNVIKRRPKEAQAQEAREQLTLDLSNSHLCGADFSRATLNGANLRGANLSRAVFDYANFQQSDFSFADLSDASLVAADLTLANFTSAELEAASFMGAKLNGAFFIHSNLGQATLAEASCLTTHFSRANLTGTSFGNADLSTADGLRVEQLADTIGHKAAKLPNGIPPPPHWPKN